MADENGTLLHMLSSEGRIVYNSNGNSWFTKTQVKDHASTSLITGFSSVLAVCSLNSTNGSHIIRQVDAYYPFGMNIKELSLLSVAKHKTAFTNEFNNRITLHRKQRAKAENTIERSSLFRSVAQNSCQIMN